jgi:hypothetical protein
MKNREEDKQRQATENGNSIRSGKERGIRVKRKKIERENMKRIEREEMNLDSRRL